MTTQQAAAHSHCPSPAPLLPLPRAARARTHTHVHDLSARAFARPSLGSRPSWGCTASSSAPWRSTAK
eukprot:4797773-Pleurochrysis_carterae.AAC.1